MKASAKMAERMANSCEAMERYTTRASVGEARRRSDRGVLTDRSHYPQHWVVLAGFDHIVEHVPRSQAVCGLGFE